MTTLVLDAQSAKLPIEHLIAQIGRGGVAVRDAAGNVVALVLSPADHEAWIYAQANFHLYGHRAKVQEALDRRAGVTTRQLLRNADEAARNSQSERA